MREYTNPGISSSHPSPKVRIKLPTMFRQSCAAIHTLCQWYAKKKDKNKHKQHSRGVSHTAEQSPNNTAASDPHRSQPRQPAAPRSLSSTIISAAVVVRVISAVAVPFTPSSSSSTSSPFGMMPLMRVVCIQQPLNTTEYQAPHHSYVPPEASTQWQGRYMRMAARAPRPTCLR